jgi:hypothetical protein
MLTRDQIQEHIDQRDAQVPISMPRRRYPNVVPDDFTVRGSCRVSSLKG